MNIKQANNIFLLGIGGIGISGVARLLHAMGKNVSGADLKESDITLALQKQGITVKIGSNQIFGQPDLVIYSPALPSGDLEQIQVPKLSHGQALGELMDGKYGIGVTGTNGKSTITAMLGLIMEKADLDPSVLIGSLLSPKNESDKFKANARFGGGKYFVAESDEYQRKMLLNRPKMIVITNIAEDHMDVYKDLHDIKNAFAEYVKSLQADGILIFNADDHNTVEVGKHASSHKFTFGIHHYADLQAVNVSNSSFDLHLNDEMIGKIKLQVPGLFNVANALGAALTAIKLGVKFGIIKEALESFAGTWRRFEIVGTLNNKPVISDYAHHPAGITGTLEAAKQFYPGKKILTVFQPHHRNRTKALFGEFVESLVTADEIIVPEIFDVAGREHGEDISSQMLVDDLNQKGAKATFAQDLDQAEKLIREKINYFDVVLLMGAGDIDLLARKLIL
ncbi:MAG: UDP-N-acetylmuramate--L-alanine ligase [Candidatus Doudnabacteria bacterium]|nr:UDP-N-acetylmuramate--L-alanine ligase [Candidatus Doudnabacteria bacterium]